MKTLGERGRGEKWSDQKGVGSWTRVERLAQTGNMGGKTICRIGA